MLIVDVAEPTHVKSDVVSDTYDNLDYVKAAVSHSESEGVDAVIHCGDIVAPFSAVPSDTDSDFHAVHGNNDGEWVLHEVVELFGTYYGDFAHLTLNGQGIAVYHGMEVGLVDTFVDSGACDFVPRGHSHERMAEYRGAAMHTNPGGLSIPGADDAFHVAVAGLDTGNMVS